MKCKTCGKITKQFRKTGKFAKYCGKKCRDVKELKSRTCRYCGKEYLTRTKNTCCSTSCGILNAAKLNGRTTERVCVGCGQEFRKKASGRNAGLYCSRECAWASKAKQGEQKRREAKESTAIADAALRWMLGWKACCICGCDFFTTGKAKYCSPACRWYQRSPGSKSCRQCGVEVQRKNHVSSRYRGTLPSLCQGCANHNRKMGNRKAKALRRARKMNNGPHDVINPLEVFERDDYVCHLCCKQTEKNTSVPYDYAPTLDHVLPLSKGGLHTLENVKTACFKCNWMKGDNVENVYGGIVNLR